MRAPTLLCVALTALGARAEPLSVVLPNLKVQGPTAARAEFFTEHLSGALSEVGAKVTTQRALAALLGIERQKQLLGCSTESAGCIAELASALGADTTLLGDVVPVGEELQLDLKIISGRDGKVLSAHRVRVKDEAGLLDELDKGAYAMAVETAVALGRDAPRPLKSKGISLRTASYVPVGLGVIGVVVGSVLLSSSHQLYLQIPKAGDTTGRPVDQVEALAQQGKTFRTVGWVCVGVGGAALATGAALWVLGGRKPPPATVTVVPGNGAATLLLSGSF